MSDLDPNTWRKRRLLYQAGRWVLFILIAFYPGPNLIIFHKLTGPTPSDDIGYADTYCLPTVRAVKQYQRDTGSLPKSLDELVPRYLSELPKPPDAPWGLSLNGNMFECMRMPPSRPTITYNFDPRAEGWAVHGHFVNGPIPMPNVTTGSGVPSSTTK